MTVTKRTRYEVLKRDNFTCRYCRSTGDELTVDHVTPVALGGSDHFDNLVAACRDCNAGKASTSPDAPLIEDVKQSDMRWAAAIKRAAEIQAKKRDLSDAYLAEFAEAWPRFRHTPTGFESTIRAFYEAGLPADVMRDAVDIAQGARGVEDRFRYFCGICWRRVGELQDAARALLEADEIESAGGE